MINWRQNTETGAHANSVQQYNFWDNRIWQHMTYRISCHNAVLYNTHMPATIVCVM